jgi:hypothetical protein
MSAVHFFNEIIAEQQLRQLTSMAQRRLKRTGNAGSLSAAKRLLRSQDQALPNPLMKLTRA